MERKGDVFVGYRRAIGIMDIEGIVSYIKNEEPLKKIYLISELPVNPVVKKYIEKNLSSLVTFELIVAKDFSKEIERIKELYNQEDVWVENLNDFGDRAMSFDVD